VVHRASPGYEPEYDGWLHTRIDPGFELPPSSLEAMMSDFMPEFAAAIAPSAPWGTLGAVVPGGIAGHMFPSGVLKGILPMALQMVLSLGDDAMPSSQFKEACNYGAGHTLARVMTRQLFFLGAPGSFSSFVMGVDEDGITSLSWGSNQPWWMVTLDPRHVGITTAPAAILCSDILLVYGALADWYFWWACRLHAWVASGRGNKWDEFIGMLCARAAVTEIAEIAGMMVHETGHLSPASMWHCQGPFGKYDCCQYAGQFFFASRVRARFGLPASHFPQGGLTDASSGRFNVDRDITVGTGKNAEVPVGASGEWQEDFTINDGYTNGCGDGFHSLRAVHCGLLNKNHKVDVSWDFSADTHCVRNMDDRSGSMLLNQDADSC